MGRDPDPLHFLMKVNGFCWPSYLNKPNTWPTHSLVESFGRTLCNISSLWLFLCLSSCVQRQFIVSLGTAFCKYDSNPETRLIVLDNVWKPWYKSLDLCQTILLVLFYGSSPIYLLNKYYPGETIWSWTVPSWSHFTAAAKSTQTVLRMCADPRLPLNQKSKNLPITPCCHPPKLLSVVQRKIQKQVTGLEPFFLFFPFSRGFQQHTAGFGREEKWAWTECMQLVVLNVC